MEASRTRAERLLRRLHAVEDGVLAALLGGMILLAVAQITLRNVFDSGLVWADPMLRLSVLWVALLGAALASRDDRQITVDVLSRLLRPRGRAAARVVTDLFTAAVATALVIHSVRLLLVDREAGVAAFAAVPAWVAELVLPVGFALVTLRYLRLAWAHLRSALGRPA